MMRVFICSTKEKELEYFIRVNQQCGNALFEEDGALYAEVLRDGRSFTADNAIQRSMSSGVYFFDDKGKPYKVSNL